MTGPTLRSSIILCLILAIPPGFADYPERAIEFVIPFDAGGGADIEGRLIAEEMSDILNVPVVPVNKPGAGGAVAYTYVNNANPDGYTVSWNSTSILTITNLGNVPFEYDALDHIGRVEYQPIVLAVSNNAPWDDFESFIADCIANPNTFKIANSGTGSATHLGALSLANAIGCEVIHLPIGTRRRNTTVLSGEADAMIAPLTGAISLVKAGRLTLLATLSTERNAVIPDVPTATELGIDSEFEVFRGLSVPKDTPEEVKTRLAEAMTRAAMSTAFMQLAEEVGFTVETMSSEEFETLMATEDIKVKDIIQNAGLSVFGRELN